MATCTTCADRACPAKHGECTSAHCLVCDTHVIRYSTCSSECLAVLRRISEAPKSWGGTYFLTTTNEQGFYDRDHDLTTNQVLDRACDYARRYGKYTNIGERDEPALREWLTLKLEQLKRGELSAVELYIDHRDFLVRL